MGIGGGSRHAEGFVGRSASSHSAVALFVFFRASCFIAQSFLWFSCLLPGDQHEKWRHGFTICGGGEDPPGTAQALRCGNRILSIAVDIMMCPELLRETFLF